MVGTHGRSIWILDDLQPIRELNAARSVFGCAPVPRRRCGSVAPGRRRVWRTRRQHVQSAAGRVDLLLPEGEAEGRGQDRDPRRPGTLVRTLSSIPREPDNSDENEDPEDLKKAGALDRSGRAPGGLGPRVAGRDENQGRQDRYGRSVEGPRAVPGPYTVRLTVDGKTKNSPLRIVADPRGGTSQSDLEAQLAHALRVRERYLEAHGARQRPAFGEGAAPGPMRGRSKVASRNPASPIC